MSKPKIKICGITNVQDALLCSAAGADYLGFIFYPKSPRYISPGKAREIIRKLPPSVQPVGVFVNEERSSIEKTITDTSIRVLQFSGDETPEDCKGYPLEVWKAFRFKSIEDTTNIHEYQLPTILLDAAVEGFYGGSGTVANLDAASQLSKHYNLVLAGGLTPANIESVLSQVRPYAVDVNSGVEFVPGKKDLSKVTLLFSTLQQLQNN